MDLRIVIKLLGSLLSILGGVILIPGIYSQIQGHNHTFVFFSTGMVLLSAGSLLWYRYKDHKEELNHKAGFAIVSLSWFTAGFVGAFPYYLSETLPSFLDAFFESTSGFSGTGSSVLQNIEGVDPAILLWRSMTQWLGGMGIIVFFIAILPILGIGGMQLFRAESPGPSKDKITPRVRDTAKNLWRLYIGFTFVLTFILIGCGMSVFDAVNHAMTTLSTGGFSTKNAGIAHFNSAAVEYAIVLFMLLGSINFSLHFKFLLTRKLKSYRDTELFAYLQIILGMSVVIVLLDSFSTALPFEENIRKTLFTVVATASSTGFTNANYMEWPVFTHLLLILLMVMGGMSGSTAGGMKCIRLVAAFKLLSKELMQVLHPNAVLGVKANRKSIRPDVASAIWGFLFLYLFTFSVIMGVLVFNGLDLESASTATFSALSNIGPAFGELGPYDNYAALPSFSKLFLALGMIVGRLEFFTVLVLLTRGYWRS